MWFPSVDDVHEIHARVLRRTGGDSGILQPGLLDAALWRARWGPFAHEGDLAERAALLLRGIAQDHPFVDGNKRTALEVVDVFLRRNGGALVAGPEEVVSFMLEVARAERSIAAIAAWLRAGTVSYKYGGGEPG